LKSKLKILLITVRADYGGGPEHIFRLLPFLKEDFELFIACPDDVPYYKKFASEIGEERLIKIPHRKFSIIMYLKLLMFITREGISIVHSHGKGAGVYSRLFKFFAFTRVIHTYHGIHTGEYSKGVRGLYLILERFFSLLSERTICVSESEAKRVIDEKICSKSKVTIIFNGVKIPENKVVFPVMRPKKILHVTRFDYAKNSSVLFEIAKELKRENLLEKFVFVVVGDGPEKKKLESLVREAEIADHFLFEGFQGDMEKYYKGAFVYLSTSRWEGLPLSVLESKSYGIPQLLTNVNGNKDCVKQGKDGFLYEVTNINKCVEYLMSLSENADFWESFSVEARKNVIENYDIKFSAEKLATLYKRGRG